MGNLVLTRKAGQAVRLMIGGEPVWLYVLSVTGGSCYMIVKKLEDDTNCESQERVRFRGEMQIAEGVTVTVLDHAKGHAKLGLTAPREVAILRTELIKENE